MSDEDAERGKPPFSQHERNGRQRVQSASLFGDDREIVIEHNGQDYRLRITAQGKLILTK